MKRKRQRFSNEPSIISMIDALNVKILQECKSAEEADKLADELYAKIGLVDDPDKLKGKARSLYYSQLTAAKEARRNAAMPRRAQGRRQKLLVRLKNTLAAFRTQPMPFLEDVSVPLARG